MSNKFLEKIAEFYRVEPHRLDKKYDDIKEVSLNRQEMDRLNKRKDDNFHLTGHVGATGVGAAAGGYVGKRVGNGLRQLGAMHVLADNPRRLHQYARQTRWMRNGGKYLGIALGADVGAKAYKNHVHNKSMEQEGHSAFLRRFKD